MKALVVDDDLSICEIIQKFLEPYGECDIAGNRAKSRTRHRELTSQKETCTWGKNAVIGEHR